MRFLILMIKFVCMQSIEMQMLNPWSAPKSCVSAKAPSAFVLSDLALSFTACGAATLPTSLAETHPSSRADMGRGIQKRNAANDSMTSMFACV